MDVTLTASDILGMLLFGGIGLTLFAVPVLAWACLAESWHTIREVYQHNMLHYALNIVYIVSVTMVLTLVCWYALAYLVNAVVTA